MVYLYLIVLIFGYLVLGSVIGSLLRLLGDNIVDYLRVSVFEPIGKQLEMWFNEEEK